MTKKSKTNSFDEIDLYNELPNVLRNMVKNFVGDGEIITEKEIIPFSLASFMTELTKVNDDESVEYFDINIFRELTITSAYKGLFTKVREINGNIKLIGDMTTMFAYCKLLVKVGDNCNTCKVTNMEGMFLGATNFNQPLKWNTKNVTNMSNMFFGATNFNQPLKWNTKNVTDMSGMFSEATSFDKPLKFTNTSNVTNMRDMFRGAYKFNQPLKWNTKNVTDMSFMFSEATSFNQILNWDITELFKRNNMFYGTKLNFKDVIKIRN